MTETGAKTIEGKLARDALKYVVHAQNARIAGYMHVNYVRSDDAVVVCVLERVCVRNICEHARTRRHARRRRETNWVL